MHYALVYTALQLIIVYKSTLITALNCVFAVTTIHIFPVIVCTSLCSYFALVLLTAITKVLENNSLVIIA